MFNRELFNRLFNEPIFEIIDPETQDRLRIFYNGRCVDDYGDPIEAVIINRFPTIFSMILRHFIDLAAYTRPKLQLVDGFEPLDGDLTEQQPAQCEPPEQPAIVAKNSGPQGDQCAPFIYPTIGQVVHFWPFRSLSDPDAQPYAAQIIYVHNNRLVTLRVTRHDGSDYTLAEVCLRQFGDDQPPYSHCEWMPHQVDRAVRQDREDSAA